MCIYIHVVIILHVHVQYIRSEVVSLISGCEVQSLQYTNMVDGLLCRSIKCLLSVEEMAVVGSEDWVLEHFCICSSEQ